jgi:nucleotidyltransferase/DNA polymerase involved in DNA repair
MCSMIVCVLIPRFTLISALDRRSDLLGRAVALAPRPGSGQAIGEVSATAEAHGIRDGMRLGEALARCPQLLLVAPDSARAEAAWEKALRGLEAIGAAVESTEAGEAFFEAGGLRGLWGDEIGVIERAKRAIGAPSRIGAGPSRLCAYAAARRARPRGRPIVVKCQAARFLHREPVLLLRGWLDDGVPNGLDRLGVRTLGELAALPREALADRFGKAGLQAHALAGGGGRGLRPRRRAESLAERIELPEATSGPQLERALEMLLHRLLANPARRGRSFRSLRLSAGLAGGGSWSARTAMRSTSASTERLRVALVPKLAQLPGPAGWLGLEALDLGPPARDQLSLNATQQERRRERLAEAVRQVRAAAGRDAVLRVLEVDPESHIPERRLMLAPF